MGKRIDAWLLDAAVCLPAQRKHARGAREHARFDQRAKRLVECSARRFPKGSSLAPPGVCWLVFVLASLVAAGCFPPLARRRRSDRRISQPKPEQQRRVPSSPGTHRERRRPHRHSERGCAASRQTSATNLCGGFPRFPFLRARCFDCDSLKTKVAAERNSESAAGPDQQHQAHQDDARLTDRRHHDALTGDHTPAQALPASSHGRRSHTTPGQAASSSSETKERATGSRCHLQEGLGSTRELSRLANRDRCLG